MNEIQRYRNSAAEMGYEYTIEETKDVMYITNELIEISKTPMNVIIESMDESFPNKEAFIKAIKKIKKSRENA
jgi:phosphopantetheinyl transferase (holo-ACP synthase)